MDKKIIWSPKAISNFENICSYISKDSPYYASLFAQRILKIVESIPSFPRSGRIVPEYMNRNLREKIYKSYRVIYRIKEKDIEVVAIFHSARIFKRIRR